MTIEFNCPHCGALIAFDSKYAGRRVKCLTCGQKCIIPKESLAKAEKIKPPPEPKGDPIPGFYRAVFLDNWKLFVDRRNVTSLSFVAAVVCFKFFLAQSCCLNYAAWFIIWGWLFGFYLNIIHDTAYDEDQLPQVEVGTSVTFLWYALAPFLTFGFTLFLVEWPFIAVLGLSQGQGVTIGNLWSGDTSLHLLARVLLIAGLALFPAAILTTAVGKDFLLLRPDYLVAPIIRAFVPYMTVAALLGLTCFLEWHTVQDIGADTLTTAMHLALNLAVQVLAILTMRSIGLLYRHYSCYFKW
jgi:hypothetical protein